MHGVKVERDMHGVNQMMLERYDAREVGVEGLWHRVLCSWVANNNFG